MRFIKTLVAGAALFLAAQLSATPVGLELVLAADVSGSIDNTEYGYQKTGYKNAFLDASVHAAIASITGGVAVTYVEWSGAAQQSVRVGWTLLQNAADAIAFGNAIGASTRAFNHMTAVGNAIQYSQNLLNTNTYVGARRIIDVSGDGRTNEGINTAAARNAAYADSIKINGITIGTESGLQAFYQNNVVTANGFHLHATGFQTFEDAIKRKIVAEIKNEDPTVPEPSTIGLLGLGLALVGFIARRRRA